MDLEEQVQRLLAAHSPDVGAEDAEVAGLGAKLAAMHLAAAAPADGPLLGDRPMTDEEFDAWIDGDNLLDRARPKPMTDAEYDAWISGGPAAPVSARAELKSWLATKAAASSSSSLSNPRPMTDEEFDAWINGDNLLDRDSVAASLKAWTTTPTKAPKPKPEEHVEGFWADIKNAFIAAYLQPASRNAKVPRALLGDSLELVPAEGHYDELRVTTAHGHPFSSTRVQMQRVRGVPNAHAYSLGKLSHVRRSDFFNMVGNLRSEQAKLTFTNPASNDPETWKLTFNNADARSLYAARVWATEPNDIVLVLRFDGEADPRLREVIVLYDGDLASSSVDGLQTLAAHALKGELFSMTGLGFDALGSERAADCAHRVLGHALATLSTTYLSAPSFAAPATSSPAAGTAPVAALKAFAVACHEDDPDSIDAGALRRGAALAKQIRAGLQGKSAQAVAATMRSLASAAAIAHMCCYKSDATSAQHRMAQFLAAPIKVRADRASLHEAFFG